jgi:hypothetical protein
MSMKPLLAATAVVGLAGFLLSQPAYSITAANLDQGARTASAQTDVIQVQEKKKAAKKASKKASKKAAKKASKKAGKKAIE